MPLFKEPVEGSNEILVLEERLNEANLTKYAEQNSLERVQGYIDCLEDMTKQFKEFMEIHGAKSWRYNTPHMVKKETIKVYEEKELLLEFAKNFIAEKTGNNKPESPNPLG